MNLKDLQKEQKEWADHNFGIDQPSWKPLLGLQEEIGELSHAYLKRDQKIRGNEVKHNANIKDAIGDIVIYLADFCSRENINLEETIEKTWSKVKKRNWKNNPINGVNK